MFESPTYRWQKYDVVTTYYWNKYNANRKYSMPLLTDGNPTTRQFSSVSAQIIEGKDAETGLSWSSAVYQPITSVSVDETTGTITGSADYSNRFYSPSYYAPSEYRSPTSYNKTCYFKTGNIWYVGTSIGAKSHSWAGIDLNLYNSEQVTGTTVTYTRGTLVQSDITSNNINNYPSDGKHTDNYWYTKQSKEDHTRGSSLLGTVTSKVETTYPENGYSGGYWYVRTS